MAKAQTLSASRAGLGSVVVDDSADTSKNWFIANIGVANAGQLSAAVTPVLVADADAFYAPAVAISDQTLQAALVADGDAFPAVSIGFPPQLLLPLLWNDADAFQAPVVTALANTMVLQPALEIDGDDILATDVGWRLFGQLLVDVDLVLSPHVETLTFLLPNIFEDGETIDSYPFFIQRVEGGIPVPSPSGVLTGSISHQRLTGTLGHRPQLTGSLGQRPQLTGSLKRRAA